MPQPRHQIRIRDRRTSAPPLIKLFFKNDNVRIGRDPASDLHLDDPFVSAQHAILTTDERGATLHDLGGTNGLRIAGKRLAPHTAVPVGARLTVSVGPFDLDILHFPDRERRSTSGALDDPGPTALDRLHADIRALHALHAPHVAARQAFETALADAVHALHRAGDPDAARRLLAEFPDHDHAHLTLPDLSLPPPPTRPHGQNQEPATTDPLPDHLSLQPASPADHLSLRPASPADHLSLRPASPDDHLSLQPAPLPPLAHSPAAPHLSLPPAPSPTPRPDHLSLRPAPARTILPLITDLAQTLLPTQRPPASHDEARRFLARVAATLRSFAAGVGALQSLRIRQAHDLGLTPLDGANPLLAHTDADDLLTALLAPRRDLQGTDRSDELLDCFAVLTAHTRAHVRAALAATRHLAAELAPAAVERHAPRSLLRSRARWHSFRERYAACLGDGSDTTGTLRRSFRAAYLSELDAHGLAHAPLPPA